MARRATLELLRTLRRRDVRAHAEGAASAAEQRTAAERAAEAARAARSSARADYDERVRAERAHVETGGATAGELARAHQGRVGVEERVERRDRAAAQAVEGAERARLHENRATLALERARRAESAVTERIAEGVRAGRIQTELRDEEHVLDAWNADRAKQRSPG
jgi:hypothetical protein